MDRRPCEYTSSMPSLRRVLGDRRVPLLERDPQLQAGQVRAEAAVDAAAEGEVAVDLAVEAHGVGVVETRPRRCWPSPSMTDDLVALGDRAAAELGVLRRRRGRRP